MAEHPEAALWRAKQAGYAAVAAIVEAERQRETPAERWRQLQELHAFAASIGWQPRDEEGIAIVRERWRRIKLRAQSRT